MNAGKDGKDGKASGYHRYKLTAASGLFVVPQSALADQGPPLVPHDLWRAWNFEPAVVVGLLLAAWLYLRGVRALWRSAGPGRGIRHWESGAFAGGWIILLMALISPLDRLGGVLFSAHMAQHELLMAAAAPLLVLGRPLVLLVWAMPMTWRQTLGGWAAVPPVRRAWDLLTLPPIAWILHALAIWLWHVPAFFQAALADDRIHALQHVSFLGTGLLFWWALLRGREGRLGRPAAVLYLFTTSVHTTVLGALLAFSPRVWYPLYASHAAAWGLTPLEDQQLAGMIMWVPAAMAYLIATLAIAASWLKETEAPARKEKGAGLAAGKGGEGGEERTEKALSAGSPSTDEMPCPAFR
jgi:cytochrome c oxidase assembly factor CtaG